MAKKISDWFRIGVEGDTCDGRVISGDDIQEMADSFDPRVYGCRINLEHFRGLLPGGDFKRLGDVVALKSDTIDDDSALNGKRALYARMAPTDELVSMVRASQKVYTSMEIRPNFANTGKCYLIGLAVTDDPASLGTEYLAFCARAKTNPLSGRKEHPDDVFSVATLATLDFTDAPDSLLTGLTDKVKALFSRKQADDDARLHDVHAAVTAIAEQVQANDDRHAARVSELAQAITALNAASDALAQRVSDLQGALDCTESQHATRRPPACGGDAESLLTNC